MLGTSMALTQTTSVHCSMAARPISGSPGAVSTTTYWNSSASCSSRRVTCSGVMWSASTGLSGAHRA